MNPTLAARATPFCGTCISAGARPNREACCLRPVQSGCRSHPNSCEKATSSSKSNGCSNCFCDVKAATDGKLPVLTAAGLRGGDGGAAVFMYDCSRRLRASRYAQIGGVYIVIADRGQRRRRVQYGGATDSGSGLGCCAPQEGIGPHLAVHAMIWRIAAGDGGVRSGGSAHVSSGVPLATGTGNGAGVYLCMQRTKQHRRLRLGWPGEVIGALHPCASRRLTIAAFAAAAAAPADAAMPPGAFSLLPFPPRASRLTPPGFSFLPPAPFLPTPPRGGARAQPSLFYRPPAQFRLSDALALLPQDDVHSLVLPVSHSR